MSEKNKKVLIWLLMGLAILIAFVSLGLMIWGSVILGVNIQNNTGDYNTFLLGGLLTGIFGFIFLFVIINLSSYLSNHKYLVSELKAKLFKQKEKNKDE